MTKLAGIRVLIWDFDGTLYHSIPELLSEMQEGQYRVIMEHMHWSREQAIAEFDKLHKKVYASATQAVAHITGLSTVQAAHEVEQSVDRTKYLERDSRLVDLFSRLSGFSHYLFVNGIRAHVEAALVTLGLAPKLFAHIVTAEIVGVNKPDEKGFRFILERTKLPAEEHLMIGDRETVDLVPAKKLGMKTCLVWAGKPSLVADVTIPTVYDVEDIVL